MQRISDTLNRLSNSMSAARLENLFFLHIPKCGGTSLRLAMSDPYRSLSRRSDAGIVHISAEPLHKAGELLKAAYPPVEPAHLHEYLLLYFMSQGRVRFIDGHVPFSAVAYQHHHPRFRFVTILRDPVERWISEYTYNKFHSGNHMRQTAEVDLNEYLDTDFSRGQGRQYVLFLGGRREDRDYASQDAIETALENTAKFDLIGCLEEMENFIAAFERRFGWTLRMRNRNVSPSPPGFVDQVFTPAIRAQIRVICAPDYMIYDHVRAGAGGALANGSG